MAYIQTVVNYNVDLDINHDWYHFSLSLFRCSIGLVTRMAIARPLIVSTNCALLKFSLNTSNVCDGATRVENKSKPWAKINEVDSRSAGEAMIRSMFATWLWCEHAEAERHFYQLPCICEISHAEDHPGLEDHIAQATLQAPRSSACVLAVADREHAFARIEFVDDDSQLLSKSIDFIRREKFQLAYRWHPWVWSRILWM